MNTTKEKKSIEQQEYERLFSSSLRNIQGRLDYRTILTHKLMDEIRESAFAEVDGWFNRQGVTVRPEWKDAMSS